MNPDEAATYALIAAHIRLHIDLGEGLGQVQFVIAEVPNEAIAYHVRSELTLAELPRVLFRWPGMPGDLVAPRPVEERRQ